MDNEDDDFGDFADFSTSASLSTVPAVLTQTTRTPYVSVLPQPSSVSDLSFSSQHNDEEEKNNSPTTAQIIHHDDDDEFGDFEDSINQATQTLYNINNNISRQPVNGENNQPIADLDDDFAEMVEGIGGGGSVLSEGIGGVPPDSSIISQSIPLSLSTTVPSITNNLSNEQDSKLVKIDPVIEEEDDFGDMIVSASITTSYSSIDGILSPTTTHGNRFSTTEPVPVSSSAILPNTSSIQPVNPTDLMGQPHSRTFSNEEEEDDEFGDMIDSTAVSTNSFLPPPNPTVPNTHTSTMTMSTVDLTTDEAFVDNPKIVPASTLQEKAPIVPSPIYVDSSTTNNDHDDAFGDFEDTTTAVSDLQYHSPSSSFQDKSSFVPPIKENIPETTVEKGIPFSPSINSSSEAPVSPSEEISSNLHISPQGHDDDSSSLGEDDFIDTGRSFDLDIQVQAPVIIEGYNGPSILFNGDNNAMYTAEKGKSIDLNEKQLENEDDDNFADFDSAPAPVLIKQSTTTTLSNSDVPTHTESSSYRNAEHPYETSSDRVDISSRVSVDPPIKEQNSEEDDDFADFSSANVSATIPTAVVVKMDDSLSSTTKSIDSSIVALPEPLLVHENNDVGDDDFADFTTGESTSSPPIISESDNTVIPKTIETVQPSTVVAVDEFDADFSSLQPVASTNNLSNHSLSPSTVPNPVSPPRTAVVDDFDAFGASSSSSIDFDTEFSLPTAPSSSFNRTGDRTDGSVSNVPSLPSIPPIQLKKESLPIYPTVSTESKTRLRMLTTKLTSLFTKLPKAEGPFLDIETVLNQTESYMEELRSSITNTDHSIEIKAAVREGIPTTLSTLSDHQQKEYINKIVTIDMNNFLTTFVTGKTKETLFETNTSDTLVTDTVKHGEHIATEVLESQYGNQYFSNALPSPSVLNLVSSSWNHPAGYMNNELLRAIQTTIRNHEQNVHLSQPIMNDQELHSIILPRPIPIASNMNSKRAKARAEAIITNNTSLSTSAPIVNRTIAMSNPVHGGDHSSKLSTEMIKTNIFSPSTQESLINSANTFSTESAVLIGNSLITEFEQSLPDMKYML